MVYAIIRRIGIEIPLPRGSRFVYSRVGFLQISENSQIVICFSIQQVTSNDLRCRQWLVGGIWPLATGAYLLSRTTKE